MRCTPRKGVKGARSVCAEVVLLSLLLSLLALLVNKIQTLVGAHLEKGVTSARSVCAEVVPLSLLSLLLSLLAVLVQKYKC